ncbi:FCGBP protein, partial [Rostratula benghalensis]|nr:FCGBP protein [Rostratula benghalensis]
FFTPFRLGVTFDGRAHVTLNVPTTYRGTLCGLCGDYDGDPRNDDPRRGAGPGAGPGCPLLQPPPCPKRVTVERKQRGGGEECGLILSPGGPFGGCHPRVDPEGYFQACVTDYCHFRGHVTALCRAIGAYAAACQSAGVVLQPWRSKTFCAPSCPPNSHYELNGTSCPPTCPRPTTTPRGGDPGSCHLPRTEGCFCDPGFLLSGHRCVPPPACGCHHGGRYYLGGEVFYPGEGCPQRCRCHRGGVVTCRDVPCPPGQQCRVVGGVRGCHGGPRGRCILLGDRGGRLVTFDGFNGTFSGGNCRYLLAKVCGGDGDNLEVTLEGDGRVTAQVGATRVTVGTGRSWRVDGETQHLPVSVDDGKTWVTQEGTNIVLETTSGHRLVYAATSLVLVTVPSSFTGQMCGLCGDFDGHGDNDLVTPNGTQVNSTQELVVAWKVPDGSTPCSDLCEKCLLQPPDVTGLYGAKDSCGLLVVTPGPFSGCHQEVGPQEFFQHCLQEMVLTAGAGDTLCRSLQAYTAACQEAGAPVKVWRTENFCPLPCGPHGLYSLCARSCRGSCARLAQALPCPAPCFEGCRCPGGFFTQGPSCLLPSTCGC